MPSCGEYGIPLAAIVAATAGRSNPGVPSRYPSGMLRDSPLVPAGVLAADARIHVRCAEGKGDGWDHVVFFAYPGGDNGATERVLSVLLTAFVEKAAVDIQYESGHTEVAQSMGCLWHDCRVMSSVEIR